MTVSSHLPRYHPRATLLAGLAALWLGPAAAAPAQVGRVAPVEAGQTAAKSAGEVPAGEVPAGEVERATVRAQVEGKPGGAGKAHAGKPEPGKPASRPSLPKAAEPKQPATARAEARRPEAPRPRPAKSEVSPQSPTPEARRPEATSIDALMTGALKADLPKADLPRGEAPGPDAARPAPKAEAPKVEPGLGPVSKLPVPRYVSLKSDRVNLREGPNKDHRTAWVFQRAGLPVEITAEFETWRRVRDSEGVEGWVLHSLLSGRRTALVQPWARAALAKVAGAGVPAGPPPIELRGRGDERAEITARLEPGVLGSIKACDGRWCRLRGEGFDGYASQEKLWGVYPGEVVE